LEDNKENERITDIADWAISSSLVDGVLFSPPDGEDALPICAVASARGHRGFGKGTTQQGALASALGEAMEQYAAARVPRERLVRASFSDLNESAFDPRWLCLYSDEQYNRPDFPFRRFDKNEPRHWIAGRWLDNDEPVYLPASAVFLSQELAADAFCQTTSSGLGAGRTVGDAIARAELELRERDAFVTSWISCRGALPVRSTPAGEHMSKISARLEAAGAQLETYLVANGDPVFVAVSVGLGDRVRWPSVTLGLGAGFAAEEAIEKAILEHGQTGPYLANVWREASRQIPSRPDQIQSFLDHALYYCDSAHRREFDEWRESSAWPSIADVHEGVRIAAADLTPPELLESPFRVVRALAKGLQPIHCGHGFERSYTSALRHRMFGRPAHTAPLPIC